MPAQRHPAASRSGDPVFAGINGFLVGLAASKAWMAWTSQAMTAQRWFEWEKVMAARHQTSFLFDLDGTLVDSVYQHVLAWRDALDQEGIELSVWRIHRKIGMSGS